MYLRDTIFDCQLKTYKKSSHAAICIDQTRTAVEDIAPTKPLSLSYLVSSLLTATSTVRLVQQTHTSDCPGSRMLETHWIFAISMTTALLALGSPLLLWIRSIKRRGEGAATHADIEAGDSACSTSEGHGQGSGSTTEGSGSTTGGSTSRTTNFSRSSSEGSHDYRGNREN